MPVDLKRQGYLGKTSVVLDKPNVAGLTAHMLLLCIGQLEALAVNPGVYPAMSPEGDRLIEDQRRRLNVDLG